MEFNCICLLHINSNIMSLNHCLKFVKNLVLIFHIDAEPDSRLKALREGPMNLKYPFYRMES